MSLSVMGQDSLVLNEREYLKMVWENSPYVKAKLLYNDVAQQQLVESRAAFQPRLNTAYESKNFNDKLYYSRLSSAVTVQTPYALKWSGGYQKTGGEYLNPEANLPQAGLAYMSLELPLGAGLFTDKKRTDVKLQRIGISSTEIEVYLQLNKYLYEAGKAYWKWYESILLRDLALEAREVTIDRFAFVRANQKIGEYAAIDTLEAFINLQNRMAFFNEQQVNWYQRSRMVYTNLGFDSVWIAPTADPNYRSVVPDTAIFEQLVAEHPMIDLFELTQLSYDAKARLAREYFKPEVNLKYSMLSDANLPLFSDMSPTDNPYLGLQFNFPLLLRGERARLKQYEVKGEMVDFEQQFFAIELTNDLIANRGMRETLDSTQRLWRATAANYNVLLNAEQKRFRIGESNNFLLNRREIQWLETRTKYIKSYVDFRIKVLEYYYLLGVLPDVVL